MCRGAVLITSEAVMLANLQKVSLGFDLVGVCYGDVCGTV